MTNRVGASVADRLPHLQDIRPQAPGREPRENLTMRIARLTSSDDQALTGFLDRLAARSPAVLAYHYPFYRDMLAALEVGEPCYLASYADDGDITGLLPLFRRRSEVGTVYSSLPFFGPNAGVICGDDGNRGQIQSALLQKLLALAQAEQALGCSVYTPLLETDYAAYDEAFPLARVVEKFTQYIDLQAVPEWDKSLQYDLRKSRREGVEISTEASPERVRQFYEIYRQNCADHGIPLKPYACIRKLTAPETLDRYAGIYFAFHGGRMIGGLLMLWSPATASYYLPCSLAEARSLQPNTLLIDAAFQAARARGCRLWNWESSPDRTSGVFRFKQKWGSQEAGYRIYAQTFRPHEDLQRLGREGIQREFPFFFVWPFEAVAQAVPA
jgi:Acetyltransferase (GNAT) domain